MRKLLILSVLTVLASAGAGCSSCRLPSCDLGMRSNAACCPQQPQRCCQPVAAPCCDPCGGGVAAPMATYGASYGTMMSEPATSSCCQ